MDSMEALMKFFRAFFGVLAGGKLRLIPFAKLNLVHNKKNVQ